MQDSHAQYQAVAQLSLQVAFHVFKTSVESHEQVESISHYLDTWLGRDAWNFDLQDCDRILRTSASIDPARIKGLLSSFGFECTELK